MKPMLTQLWPQFTADAAFMDSYGSAIVERVVADRQNNHHCGIPYGKSGAR